MSTFIVTLPDEDRGGQPTGFAEWDPWRVIVAMFPELSGDCMYVRQDDFTRDQVARHSRTGVTVRKIGTPL